MDEDPVNGGWDGNIYPANPGVFDPTPPRDYGTAPVPPANTELPGDGLPSPHGLVVNLPNEVEFIGSQDYGSLLFRVDGSVEAVTADNVPGDIVAEDGLNWVVRIRHTRYGLTRTITISRNGRVVVSTP